MEINKEELTLRKSLSTLTEDIKFLPDRGYLGFGLHYMYPTLFNCEFYRLGEAMGSLKGREAMIMCVLDQLGLCPFPNPTAPNPRYLRYVTTLSKLASNHYESKQASK